MGLRFTRNPESSGQKGPASVASKIGATLFFGFFLIMGLVAGYFILQLTLQTLTTFTWKEVPAKILQSEVRHTPGKDEPFSIELRFEYEWEGQIHRSTKYSLMDQSEAQYDSARKMADALPVGGTVTCLVNPSSPSEAILRRDSLWFGLFALIPLVFIAVGGGGIYFTWSSKSARTEAISPGNPTKKSGSRLAPILIGLIFSLVGAGLLVFWYLPTVFKAQASKNWAKTPCTVISSRVKTHTGGDSTTYSVDIFYRYTVSGQEYKSNRYKLFGGSSSGRAAKADVVRSYPPGSPQHCYVNPENPHEAVLKPGVGWELLLGLIPVAFLTAGIFVLIWGLRSSPPNISASGPSLPGDAGPVTLKSAATPLGKLIGILIAALFWNGIVSVFLWQVVDGFQRGRPEWFLVVFLTPFVLVGLGLLGAVGYFLLALANPRARLQISSSALVPGESFTVTWEFRGAVHRLNRLRIVLEGREEATYRRGTSNATDKEVFAQHTLAEPSNLMEMRQGSAEFLLPPGSMPGFSADHNKLVWNLSVHGSIARWPDLKEEYPVSVIPPKISSAHV